MKKTVFLTIFAIIITGVSLVSCNSCDPGGSSSGGGGGVICQGNDSQITLQAENGTGAGQRMSRSRASGLSTVWLHVNETRTITFTPCSGGNFRFKIRYSNDNFGPLETLTLSLNGNVMGQFVSEDTGDWNNFFDSPILGNVSLQPNTSYTITITVLGGDPYGIEIDCVLLEK